MCKLTIKQASITTAKGILCSHYNMQCVNPESDSPEPIKTSEDSERVSLNDQVKHDHINPVHVHCQFKGALCSHDNMESKPYTCVCL